MEYTRISDALNVLLRCLLFHDVELISNDNSTGFKNIDDNICSKMLEHASLSKIRCKHCACLAIGCKIITYGINNDRTKWNHELYCCSHSEIQCLYNWWNRQIKGNTNRYRIKEIKKKLKQLFLISHQLMFKSPR